MSNVASRASEIAEPGSRGRCVVAQMRIGGSRPSETARRERRRIVAVALAMGVGAANSAGLTPGVMGTATALGPHLPAAVSAVRSAKKPAVKAVTLTVQDPALGPFHFAALVAGDPQEARRGKLVLFLHGFPETAEAFRAILPNVARAGYYAVAFSQRGYSPGARPSAIDAYNILNLVGDVTRVAASLGAPNFHLVGHDWGGGVAWVTAAFYPKLVTGLTVLSTPHPDALSAAIANPKSPQHAASNYMATLRAPGSQNRILANGVKGFKALFALGGGRIPATSIRAYARVLATPAALGAAINWYRANLFPTPRIGPIKVPTLYLWGSSDAVFLRSTAQATAANVAGPYAFCALPGQGHWLPEDAGAEIMAALLPQLAGSRLRCPSKSVGTVSTDDWRLAHSLARGRAAPRAPTAALVRRGPS